MPYEIVLAPEAAEDLRRLIAHDRSAVRHALEAHMGHEPKKVSRSPIKRLRGLARPQYRLRVGEVRVFYDVDGKPAGLLIGFKSEDEWFEYRLQTDPRFLKRVEAARRSIAQGRGVKIEDVEP